MAFKFHNFYSFASLKTECLALFEAAVPANTQKYLTLERDIFNSTVEKQHPFHSHQFPAC